VTERRSTKGKTVLEDVENEIEIHAKLCVQDPPCPFIVRLIASCRDRKYIYQIIEHARNGELLDVIMQQHPRYKRLRCRSTAELKTRYHQYEMNFVRPWLLQICRGVRFMHKLGICHNDISLENILVDDQYRCLICDFGLAKQYPPCVSGFNFMDRGYKGKPIYAAPELYKDGGHGRYDASWADQWAIGACAYVMMFLQRPYTSAGVTCSDFVEEKVRSRKIRGYASREFVQFLGRIFRTEPAERFPNMDALLADPIFNAPNEDYSDS